MGTLNKGASIAGGPQPALWSGASEPQALAGLPAAAAAAGSSSAADAARSDASMIDFFRSVAAASSGPTPGAAAPAAARLKPAAP